MRLNFRLKLLVSCFVFLLISLVFFAQPNLNSCNIEQKNFTVVIDAGHGGRDGGVVGKTLKTKEATINLAIAQALEKILVDNGFKVVMTRTTQDGLYGDAKQNRKLQDMQERVRIINQAQPDLVISIHQNSFVKGAERGAQVFYSIGCDKDGISCKIANIVQARLNQELDGTDRKVKSGDFYIVKKTQFPSILVECGFITTREDELLLVTPEYQQKVANLIFEGILESKQKVLDVQKHIL